jgi:diamine N-acetyltransferase
MKKEFCYLFNDIILAPLDKESLSTTLIWRNFYKDYFTYSEIISLEQHYSFFEKYKNNPDDFIFIITNKAADLIGQISVYNIDKATKKAEFGRIMVAPDFVGKGFSFQALLAVMALSKEIFDLNQLYLSVKCDNTPAIKLYEKGGFQTVGLDENQQQKMVVDL